MALAARRTHRARPLTLLLVMAALTLLALDQAGDGSLLHPVRAAVRDGFASTHNTLTSWWPGGGQSATQAENKRLRSQVDDLHGQLSRTDDIRRDRDRLNQLLALPTVDNAVKIVAPVTAMGASNFDATVEIGKGSDAGVASGMPVVTPEGLLGRVVQTSHTRSTVLLLTDTTANTGVRFATGDVAVAAGQGMRKPLRADLLELATQVKPGDVAVTSGMQHSVYPPGIPVGRVLSTDTAPQALRRNVTLAPVTDVNKLDDVAVLKWLPQ